MAYALLAIGILMLFAMSVMASLVGSYESAAGYGIFGTLLVAFTAIYLLKIKPANEHVSRDKLVEWIKNNSKTLEIESLEYAGIRVTKDTVLIKYCIVYSAVIFTRKTFSNYCVDGSSRSARVAILSTAFNLFFGWWGIPWGIIYTSQSLYLNIGKKMRTTVADIMAGRDIQGDVRSIVQ